jgi:Flp pilus assembly protein TadD
VSDRVNIPLPHMDLRMSGGTDPDVQIARAQSALEKGDIDLAAQILSGLHTVFPRHSAAYVLTAHALVQQGQADQADDLLAKGRTLLPQDISIPINHAWIAHNRGLTAEAVRLWMSTQEQFPDHALAYAGMITSLRAGKRNDEAEAAAAVAMARFPADQAVHAQAARTAMARGDWQNAADRWQIVRDRFRDIAG